MLYLDPTREDRWIECTASRSSARKARVNYGLQNNGIIHTSTRLRPTFRQVPDNLTFRDRATQNRTTFSLLVSFFASVKSPTSRATKSARKSESRPAIQRITFPTNQPGRFNQVNQVNQNPIPGFGGNHLRGLPFSGHSEWKRGETWWIVCSGTGCGKSRVGAALVVCKGAAWANGEKELLKGENRCTLFLAYTLRFLGPAK